MKQRMGVRISGDGHIKGVENELVVVVSANGKRDDTFVFEVKDSA